MPKKPIFKSYYTNLKLKINKLRETNPALFLFLVVSVVGLAGIFLVAFDSGFELFPTKVSIQSEKSYDYIAQRVYGSNGNVIGYKINYDKSTIKVSSAARGAHSIEQFIEETDSCAAINANFYHTDGRQLGLYADNYNKCKDCPSRDFVDTLFLKSTGGISDFLAKTDNYYFINDIYWQGDTALPSGIQNGTAGKLVLKDGKAVPLTVSARSYTYLGWDDKGEIYAFSFEPGSAVIQIQAMLNNGVMNAIMLDGGGSSQMYSRSGIEGDSTKKNIIEKTRKVPYYIGAGDCNKSGQPSQAAQVTTQPVECKVTKAGFNPGSGVSEAKADKYFSRAKEFGMNSLLAILEEKDNDFADAKEFIEKSNKNNIKPILRFCTGSASCQKYADATYMAGFIKRLSQADIGNFAVILGPNEPNLEKWKGDDFRKIGEFTAEVAGQLQDLNNVDLLSVAFDTAYHLNMSKKLNPSEEYIEISKVKEYFEGLGDRKLLDGIAINTYNKDGVTASDRYEYFINYLKAKGFGFEGNFSKVYITEFGYYTNTGNISDGSVTNLKGSFDKLKTKSEIQSILFFTPLSDIGNSAFTQHHISKSNIQLIIESSGCNGNIQSVAPDDSNVDTGSSNTDSNTTQSTIKGIVNTKLEYCSQEGSVGSSSKNCIPYARYYDEPMTELLSCQTLGIDNKKTVDKLIELKYDSASNSYIGQAILAGRIRNFPMLRHFGSSSFGEYGGISSINPTTEGTLNNPYQPVCSFLSETFGKNGISMYLTHEFEGKVIFYDTHGNSYEYAMPRLGNGIGCLNLLSSKIPASNLSGSLESDFGGFNISNMTKQQQKVAACKSKQAKLLQSRSKSGASFEEIVADLTKDPDCQFQIPDDSDTYDTEILGGGNIFDKKEQGTPVFDYAENQRYCSNSNTYGGQIVRNINTGSNSLTESYRGPAKALRVENIKINLTTECTKPANLFLLRDQNGASLKTVICSGNAGTKAYLPVSLEIPTYIGIPGGISAYSILTEYVQNAAENKVGKIITPPNGVKLYSEFTVMPGNGEAEVGDTLDFKKEDGDPTIEYVVPYLDYQPLLVALQYVLNNENESGIETNN
jgi:exopolysaccharide biosynthesis protein